jgi:hypothetical protein
MAADKALLDGRELGLVGLDVDVDILEPADLLAVEIVVGHSGVEPSFGTTHRDSSQASVSAARISFSVSIGLLGRSDLVIAPPLKVN